jgi:hypothetical protein
MLPDKYIGLILAVSSSFFIGFSFTLTKRGLMNTKKVHGKFTFYCILHFSFIGGREVGCYEALWIVLHSIIPVWQVQSTWINRLSRLLISCYTVATEVWVDPLARDLTRFWGWAMDNMFPICQRTNSTDIQLWHKNEFKGV